MIILDATTKSLQIKLGGTVTTNQLPFSASYIDATSTATTPGENDGASNNTTAVALVSAPSSSTQRLVKNIVIQNADTATATVTIIYNNNSTLRSIIVATLAVGDQLIYEDGNGWVSIDKNGNTKTTGGAVSSVTNTDGTLTISPTTGNVVASLTFPTWNIIGKSGAGSSHTGDTSQAILATVTIPAGAMGPNGVIRVTSLWSYTNSANNKYLRWHLGGIGGPTIWGATVTTTAQLSTIGSVQNANSASSQKFWGGSSFSPYTTSTAAIGTGAVDTSVATTLVLTGELANSGETVTLESYLVELMYGA